MRASDADTYPNPAWSPSRASATIRDPSPSSPDPVTPA